MQLKNSYVDFGVDLLRTGIDSNGVITSLLSTEVSAQETKGTDDIVDQIIK